MRQGDRHRGTLLAVVLGCVMLVQSMVAGWAAGSMPMPQLDIFGNPLCISEGSHSSDGSEHGKLPLCCTMGCSLGSHALPAPELISAPVEWPVETLAWLPRLKPSEVVIRPSERPGRPRGPPQSSR